MVVEMQFDTMYDDKNSKCVTERGINMDIWKALL